MRSKADEVRMLMEATAAFADAMENRLIQKMADGHRGWDNKESIPHIKELLRKNLQQGNDQLVDVANLAMMLWYHWKLTPEGQRGRDGGHDTGVGVG